MSVSWANDTIVLAGSCGVEEGERLLTIQLDHPDTVVEWRECTYLHTAIVQVLLAAKVIPVGSPGSPFLRDVIGPVLTKGLGPPLQ